MRPAWLLAAVLIGGCGGNDARTADARKTDAANARIAVTIDSANGAHGFSVEVARTAAEQQRGLMFRTDIPKDGGMLFAPYPPGGGAPQSANFWMKDTPTPLDIVYIRADHSIARIAENTVPFSESVIPSGEPVAAVLEITGGRAAELGIGEGDKVRWTAP